MGIWEEIYLSFLQALKTRTVESWLVERTQNRAELLTQYRSLESIESFVKFLQEKVAEEKYGNGETGLMYFSIGGR
jgi:site-specific recombinase XerD